MPVVFNATTRKSVSRRIVKIPVENDAYDQAITNMNNAAATYGTVDDGNKAFFDNYLNLSTYYETERGLKDGVQAGTLSNWETEMTNSVNQVAGNLFFPTTTPFNMDYFPLVIPQINGGSPTTAPNFERSATKGILTCDLDTNSPSGNGITNISTVVQTGFAYGATATNLTAPYIAGSGTLLVTSSAGFLTGEYILVSGGGSAGIFAVLGIPGPGTSLTVYDVCCSAGGLPIGSAVTRNFVGFTEGERTSGVATAPAYQDILDKLTITGTNSLVQRVLDWETILNTQRSNLVSNDDARAPYQAQNTAEIAAIDLIKVAIDAWQVIAPPGNRFNNANLAALNVLISNRVAALPGRVGQITTSLGSNVIVDSPYYQRYKYLDIRINRVYGSLQKKEKSNTGSGIINYTKANNIVLLNDYDDKLLVSKLSVNGDGTVYITLDSSTGFNIADTVYIISEDQPEIVAVIQNKSANVLTLNVVVSNLYTVTQLARCVKVL